MKKHIKDESIDLVYLDPPFKSNSDYNGLFKAGGLAPDEAQMSAFNRAIQFCRSGLGVSGGGVT